MTVLTHKMRPGKVAAAGSVTVQFVVVKIKDEAVTATVWVAELIAAGGCCSEIGPATVRAVAGVVVPIPTLPVKMAA